MSKAEQSRANKVGRVAVARARTCHFASVLGALHCVSCGPCCPNTLHFYRDVDVDDIHLYREIERERDIYIYICVCV